MTEDQGLQRWRITAKAPVEDYPQRMGSQLGQHPHPQPQQGPRPRLLQMEVLLERVNHRLQELSDDGSPVGQQELVLSLGCKLDGLPDGLGEQRVRRTAVH